MRQHQLLSVGTDDQFHGTTTHLSLGTVLGSSIIPPLLSGVWTLGAPRLFEISRAGVSREEAQSLGCVL